jgi:hypothetical protein
MITNIFFLNKKTQLQLNQLLNFYKFTFITKNEDSRKKMY